MTALQVGKAPKICFVGLSAYSLLSGKNLGHIVGPDVYQFFLAHALLNYDFKISFITYNEGESLLEHLNGIDIIRTYRRINSLNSALKALYIWRAMRKAKADIYFQQGGAGIVTPLFCRLNRKRCVVSVGSDAYVQKNLIKELDHGSLSWLTSELEIKLADIVTVQSEFQKIMLKRNFGKDGLLIKNPFPLIKEEIPKKAYPPIVLWVGSVAEVKQPELFLKLAKLIPEAKFQMIAARGYSEEHYKRIEEASKNTSNLDFIGFVPFNEVNQYFEIASILVNTSKFEGFPNAFIQAWMNYTPVVSLNADPDEIIVKYKLGFHSRKFDQLVEDIKILLNDGQMRQEMGENGRLYVEREHEINKVVKQYLKVFSQLLR